MYSQDLLYFTEENMKYADMFICFQTTGESERHVEGIKPSDQIYWNIMHYERFC